ncbi:hypothetical protein P9273_02485 [Mesorhizobium sp. WSM4935]|uniref:hypothetical protein n=1 Tax=Mesorhizobium sp. WSM4935 TaxID=3038547 RepID=UPI00241542DA|nr:hypothetical protein [Mesorhizobium sp. WSM4935]MDG4873962.1 hypothetical protein [Mesorhizobium sp. WSM4935]
MTPMEPVVNALWVGDALGEIHAACLRSFLLAGHRVLLHCYDVPGNVPKGVEIFDASRLMPRERIITYRSNGSPSLFSNLYRLKILEAGMGLYVDCDVYCLKPIPQVDYIFGYQTDIELNGAVLKLPADSDMLREALKMVDDPYFIAPWLCERKRRRYRWRKAIGLPIDISHYGWGMLGPCLCRQDRRHRSRVEHRRLLSGPLRPGIAVARPRPLARGHRDLAHALHPSLRQLAQGADRRQPRSRWFSAQPIAGAFRLAGR